MAICSVLVGVKLSLVAASFVINERWEPSSKRMLPLILNPLVVIGAIAVFNKLIVVGAELHLVEHEPWSTGVAVESGCVKGFVSAF